MMNRRYISDEEFDNLNYHEQMKYKWCCKCKHFYHYEKGNCPHAKFTNYGNPQKRYSERLTK